MQLYLSSGRPEVLEEARAYLEEKLAPGKCKKEKEGSGSVEYTVRIADDGAEALLDQLLALSPDLDISGTVISDVEGRDRSFWSTTRYQSAVDQDGKRYFEVSGSTGWA